MRTILHGLFIASLAISVLQKNALFGWFGIILFGGGSLFLVIKFFQNNFYWANNPNSIEFKEQTEREFKEIFNNNGIFTFNDDGFSIETDNGVQAIEWLEIKSMLGYKEDHYATDCICLDVFCDHEKSFKITEETLGWFRFLEHSKKAFPNINQSWEIEISTPVFETNLTVVYDRQDRKLRDVKDEHYKS